MSSIVYRNIFSMGTRLDIVLPGVTEDLGDVVFQKITRELNRLEEKISIYKETSDFSIINHNAFEKPQKSHQEIFILVEKLLDLSQMTKGYFDFTMGHVLINQNKNIVPTEAEVIYETNSGSCKDKIQLDHDNKTIAFNHKLVALDSGGFGKGLGLDAVKTILIEHDIEMAFVNFGSSSVYAHGHHPFGDSWKTGICNIFKETENAFVFDLQNEAMSVSGNNPQNIKKHGTGHIINPFSGKPVEGYFQCAVSGENGLITEVISTALSCAPPGQRDEIMSNFPLYKAVIIQYEKSNEPIITYSSNIK